jgi:hypothetical protein
MFSVSKVKFYTFFIKSVFGKCYLIPVYRNNINCNKNKIPIKHKIEKNNKNQQKNENINYQNEDKAKS